MLIKNYRVKNAVFLKSSFYQNPSSLIWSFPTFWAGGLGKIMFRMPFKKCLKYSIFKNNKALQYFTEKLIFF
jgi:hypothetical protein